MKQFSDIQSLRDWTASLRENGETLGFVPTMGNLHEGHLSLVDEAAKHSDQVIVSIFVNPMQFDRADDLAAYPRTLDEDMALLEARGVAAVFTPTPEMLYPQGLDVMTRVEVPDLGDRLEGGSRPGHFTGVSTVVTKLFNLVQSDIAVFGEKDFQQLAIIRKMVNDLNMPVKVMSLATVREPDGLAMSSRNGYLTADERAVAPVLYQTLEQVREGLLAGRKDFSEMQAEAIASLKEAGFGPDYVEICSATTLLPALADDLDVVVLGSAWLGKARLIDNIPVSL